MISQYAYMGVKVMSERLFKVEERVAALLKEKPALRSCDRLLIYYYMKIYHQIVTFEHYAFSKDAPTVESIRRCRQKLQEMGKFPPTQSTEHMRDVAMDEYHKYATNEARQCNLFD